MNIHPDDREMFDNLRRRGFKTAAHLGIEVREIEPKRRPLHGTSYGMAYMDERRIAIVVRWRQYADMGGDWYKNRLPDGVIIDTLVHELAHLMARQRHGRSIRMHGPEFKGCMGEIKEVFEAIG